MLNDLNKFYNEMFMSQYVNKPTHDYSVLPVLQSTSHHSIVMVSTSLKVQSLADDDDQPEPHSKFNALNFFSDEIILIGMS